MIGKAVQAARARADRLGGGKTFRRILEQQGLARIVPPATASRLLQIMEHLPEVSVWHASLCDQQQVAWASSSAVFKHCPVFTDSKTATQPKRGIPIFAPAQECRLRLRAAFFNAMEKLDRSQWGTVLDECQQEIVALKAAHLP